MSGPLDFLEVARDVIAGARGVGFHGVPDRCGRRAIKAYTETAVPYGRVPATCPVRAVRALLAALADAGR
ncbi:hypothetical protein AB0J28_41230, partial [Streptosporangium canum]|uniref:hypothetical protein n=1 Tax=Streptosporangium canum TaxID=324952 RepID=UPI00343CA47B